MPRVTCALTRFADHTRETFDAAIAAALEIATREFAPHNRVVDSDEPALDGERVRLPAQTGRALKAFVDAGFVAATFDTPTAACSCRARSPTPAGACSRPHRSASTPTAA